MADIKKKILAVVGPTASGKTSLAIFLAERFGGEIISCDSMQIYRYMNIGTAKPTEEEQAKVPHHLIDFVDPASNFSAADYAPLAREKVEEVLAKGKLPIFCGGTGLYLDAFLSNTVYSDGETDEKLRASLFAEAEEKGGESLWERLNTVDPISAAAIHPNNLKRVIRALEIFEITGKPKSEWDAASRLIPSPYDCLKIGISFPDRQTLYDRIDRRVDQMMADGLTKEVKNLVASGLLPRDTTAAQAIGYKEILRFLDGEITEAEAVDFIKQATRRYAKRQLTWFRRDPNTKWWEPPLDAQPEALCQSVSDHLKS